MLKPQVVDQHAVIGVAPVVSWQAYDADGVAADPGTVTVTVTNLAGTALATDAATSGTTTSPRTKTLSAIAAPDLLTCVWSVSGAVVARTKVAVNGGIVCPLPLLRARKGLDNVTTYPNATLVTRLAEVVNRVETVTGALVPRVAIDRADVRHGEWGYLPKFPNIRSVRSLVVDDIALSTDDYHLDGSAIRFDNRQHGELVLTYEHGRDACPPDLRRAIVDAVAFSLLGETSGQSMRQTSVTNEFGSTNFARPNNDHPFGLPDVDAIIMRHDRRVLC